MFDSLDVSPEATIKVMGVGGAGGNALNAMVRKGVSDVSFVAINTDSQALKSSDADTPVQIGLATTKGYGAGTDPMVGYDSAKESKDIIQAQLEGVDMLFIAAGMGGGTGTGAAPFIAEMAKEMGILTVAVVTKPFSFEGSRRKRAADMGIDELRQKIDALIVIENDNLLTELPENTGFLEAFKLADEVLCSAVYAIAEVITTQGMVNVDFADVKTVMSCKGRAIMGAGEGRGENKAVEAAQKAIDSPLLERFEVKEAKGILCTITHGLDFSLNELSLIGSMVQDLAHDDAVVVIGTIPRDDLEDTCIVTVIATGIDVDRDSVVEVSQAKTVTSSSSTISSSPVVSPSVLESPSGISHSPKPIIRSEPVAQSKPSVKPPVEESNGFKVPSFLRGGRQ